MLNNLLDTVLFEDFKVSMNDQLKNALMLAEDGKEIKLTTNIEIKMENKVDIDQDTGDVIGEYKIPHVKYKTTRVIKESKFDVKGECPDCTYERCNNQIIIREVED